MDFHFFTRSVRYTNTPSMVVLLRREIVALPFEKWQEEYQLGSIVDVA